MGEIHLELRPDAGQRAPELVAGVGDEATLAIGRILQPAQHGVHRAGQPPDLVGRLRLGHPPVEVLGADLLHLPAHRLDGPQGAPGDDPGGDPHQGEQDGKAGREEPHQAAHALVDRFETPGDVDDEVTGLGGDPTRHDTEGAFAGGKLRHAACGVAVFAGLQRAEPRFAFDVGRFGDDLAAGVDDLHEVLVAAGYGQRGREVAVGDGGHDVARTQARRSFDVVGERVTLRSHQPHRAGRERKPDHDHCRQRDPHAHGCQAAHDGQPPPGSSR